jgi:hypothetical protein
MPDDDSSSTRPPRQRSPINHVRSAQIALACQQGRLALRRWGRCCYVNVIERHQPVRRRLSAAVLFDEHRDLKTAALYAQDRRFGAYRFTICVRPEGIEVMDLSTLGQFIEAVKSAREAS